jgi:hypothetical protein
MVLFAAHVRVGILYDDDALDAAWNLVKTWTARRKLRRGVAKDTAMKAILIVALLLWPSIATAADDDVLLGVTLGDDGRPYLLHLPIEGGCADFLAAFQKAKQENRKPVMMARRVEQS